MDDFEDWMLKDTQAAGSLSDESVNSFSWFEPLEQIISSGSSSSGDSPVDVPSAEQPVKQEELATLDLGSMDAAAGAAVPAPTPAEAATVEATPTATTSSSSSVADATVAPAKRRRAPRKRLTSHQKQAHNKIEKRYRININTKIAKLQQIIPWVASEQTAFEVGENIKKGEDGFPTSTKLNKSMILEKAVDYILYLQNSERLYEMEVRRLRAELAGQN
ncbi:hypothetical protein ZYGR_0N01860 [Zygosaccharomyces rouxii]|uniref:ZYRO0D04642p n=2 Tax=Zygosaccharomyces rouxii TaxID=4956 RepID=C5DV82_ZYGRC|nr:uncharacterized protein ZYRO0D04642g [Zygosaccharomyces rouxii]KAH9200615.1 helix-loop-helix DNA-binding domain-containing protein [Zygosaccharomyces rouxii]GAV48781.1 hypothetical protein ZYGR_0N01860 [Zygosaccharomyces rouxii]CAR27701.1 ZYRO0D04642p [Zygosaccharomyces rouxii]